MSAVLHLRLVAALAQTETPDLNETTREQVGRFVVEHERFERRGTLIMHVANAWQKVRLVWQSREGTVRLVLEDNGGTLAMSWAVASPTPDRSCSGGHPPVNYALLSGKERDWRQIGALFRGHAKPCGLPYTDAVSRARGEFDAALTDFPAASLAMRATATRVFGGVARRCIAFDVRPAFDPFRGAECIRWSGPVLARKPGG